MGIVSNAPEAFVGQFSIISLFCTTSTLKVRGLLSGSSKLVGQMLSLWLSGIEHASVWHDPFNAFQIGASFVLVQSVEQPLAPFTSEQ